MPKKIIHKRAFEKGVRPDGSYLTPGEWGLNLNSSEPGAFFMNSSGRPVKVGPTAVQEEAPKGPLSSGEMWYDRGKDVLKICLNPDQGFAEVRSKLVTSGGNNVFYVNPSDPEASDSFLNDGLTLPFRSLNRAAIEVARKTIIKSRDDRDFFGRYTIVVLPGINTVFNGPGQPVSYFTSGPGYVAEGKTAVLPDSLEKFNSTRGGVVIPRGCSVVGFNQYKSQVLPNHSGSADSRSEVLLVTGGSSVSNLTFRDKNLSSIIVSVAPLSPQSLISVFGTLEPNGFRIGDKISLSVVEGLGNLASPDYDIFSREKYWVEPLDDKLFLLRRDNPSLEGSADYVLTTESFSSEDSNRARILATFEPVSHDQLSAIGVASRQELSDFYVKVQKAFPKEFSFSYSNHEITSREISGHLDISNLVIRSDYGLSGVSVKGVSSAKIKNCSFESRQSSPTVYQTYYLDGWLPLLESYRRSERLLESEVDPKDSISYLESLSPWLKRVEVTIDPKGSTLVDRRTYGVRSEGRSSTQVLDCEFSGPHIGIYSREGSKVESRNNFFTDDTVVKLLAEGRSSNTSNGVFTLVGIQEPEPLEPWESESMVKYLKTNLTVTGGSTSGEEYDVITLSERLDRSVIYPYTLKTGSAVWAKIKSSGVWKKAIIAQDYDPSSTELKLVKVGNQLNGEAPSTLSPIYIRRCVDERNWWEGSYKFKIEHTKPIHPGQILTLGSDTDKIRAGSQLDPIRGGLGQVFSVDKVHSTHEGVSLVSLSLSDFVRPFDSELTYNLGDRVSKDRKVMEKTPLGWKEVPYTYVDQNFNLPFLRPSEELTGIKDDRVEDYVEGDCYIRGIKVNSGKYELILDYDDGTDGLGISGVRDPVSKESASRFLSLLGYDSEGVEEVLSGGNPEPSLGDPGYATEVFPWPLNLVEPSTIETDYEVPSLSLFGGRIKTLD